MSQKKEGNNTKRKKIRKKKEIQYRDDDWLLLHSTRCMQHRHAACPTYTMVLYPFFISASSSLPPVSQIFSLPLQLAKFCFAFRFGPMRSSFFLYPGRKANIILPCLVGLRGVGRLVYKSILPPRRRDISQNLLSALSRPSRFLSRHPLDDSGMDNTGTGREAPL